MTITGSPAHTQLSRRHALQIATMLGSIPSGQLAAQQTSAPSTSSVGLEHHTFRVNGVSLHVAIQGTGPLVILCHGWPELWYAWRHQLPALAAAGYRAAALDLRGFGASDAPAEVEAYTIFHLVGDVTGLIGALGERQAVVVGHDWGAVVAWYAAMFRPDLIRAVVSMSVPAPRHAPAPPIRALREAGQNRFYMVYFQEPGVAEAEFERDPAATLRRILFHFSGEAPEIRAPGALQTLPMTGGFLDIRPDTGGLPSWLTEQDLAYMATEYRRTGFRGGLNLYRAIDRNWELLGPWQGATVSQPALFIAGSRDAIFNTPRGRTSLEAMPNIVPNLRRTLVIDGAGHYIQQERPEQVNATLVEFLRGLPG